MEPDGGFDGVGVGEGRAVGGEEGEEGVDVGEGVVVPGRGGVEGCEEGEGFGGEEGHVFFGAGLLWLFFVVVMGWRCGNVEL